MTNRDRLSQLTDEEFVQWCLDDAGYVKDMPNANLLGRGWTNSKFGVQKWLGQKAQKECNSEKKAKRFDDLPDYGAGGWRGLPFAEEQLILQGCTKEGDNRYWDSQTGNIYERGRDGNFYLTLYDAVYRCPTKSE